MLNDHIRKLDKTGSTNLLQVSVMFVNTQKHLGCFIA